MTKEQMEAKLEQRVKDTGPFNNSLKLRINKDFIWTLILDGRPEGKCEHCAETFPMMRKDQKFCKRECKRAAHNQIRKVKDAGKDYEE